MSSLGTESQGPQRMLKGPQSPVISGHFLNSPFSGLLHLIIPNHRLFLLIDKCGSHLTQASRCRAILSGWLQVLQYLFLDQSMTPA